MAERRRGTEEREGKAVSALGLKELNMSHQCTLINHAAKLVQLNPIFANWTNVPQQPRAHAFTIMLVTKSPTGARLMT